jgi:peptidyl-tRNA hydrolase
MIDYVLDRFTPEERERLAAVLSRAVDAVMTLVKDGLDTAMTEYNRAPDD